MLVKSPIKCRFCITNAHAPDYKCDRVFISPQEAYDLFEYDLSDNTVHVFITDGRGVIIGHDWDFRDIKHFLEQETTQIEIADPEGKARGMRHGICANVCIEGYVTNSQDNIFFSTDEAKLKAFEELHSSI